MPIGNKSVWPDVRDHYVSAVLVGHLHIARPRQLARKFSFAVDLSRRRRSVVQSRPGENPGNLAPAGRHVEQATIPVMLISLGYRLHEVESLQWGHALGGALVRTFGGFAAANIAVLAIGATGVNRQVLLLYGALPAAVINFVLTEKYRKTPLSPRQLWSSALLFRF